jgi:hypothetical protein
LLHLAKKASTSIISGTSENYDSPSMKRVILRSPGVEYAYVAPCNWKTDDHEAPRPLRIIEGEVTDIGDLSMRNTLLTHPLWARCDVSSFGFWIGADPHADANTRRRHGLAYNLTARDGAGKVVAHKEGVLGEKHLEELAHDTAFESIANTIEKHVVVRQCKGGAT